MELNPYLSPFTVVNLRWIKDLEVRPETVKLLEEGIGPTLQNIGTYRSSSTRPPKVSKLKQELINGMALN